MYVNLNMSQKNCNRKIAKCTLQGDPKCMKVVIPLCPIQCYTLNAQQPDSNVIINRLQIFIESDIEISKIF